MPFGSGAHSLPSHRPFSPRTNRACAIALGTAAALAATPALAPAATAAGKLSPTSNATAVVTDGCGRLDSIEVEGAGTFWLQLLPDGKAPKAPTAPKKPSTTSKTPEAAPPATLTEAEWAAALGYQEMKNGAWTRSVDASTTFLAVRVLTYAGNGAFEYVPLSMAGADPDTGTRGTETFKVTNADCVIPLEPSFEDLEGSEQDTVTIPAVTGVKYSGKPGTTPGKGTVTVTATPDKGYRLANPDGTPLTPEQTRWTYTFDGTAPVTVPKDKAPTFRKGAPVKSIDPKKPAKPNPNIVTVQNVPGVTWIVDGKPAKTSDKAPTLEVAVGDKTSVKVQAVSADPKKFTLSGTTEWILGGSGAGTAALPRVVVPTALVSPGASTLTWAAPAQFPDGATYNVRYRVITLTGNKVRAAAPWRPWYQETRATRAVMRARPGSIIEVQVQAVAKNRTISPWSRVTTVWFPYDIAKAPNPAWKLSIDRAAFGRTMLTSNRRTAGWRATTPTTNRVMLWFGTSPTGAPALVYIDGKRVATMDTRSTGNITRRVLKPIPVLWGKHVVTVVHGGKNGQTLHLDGVAYGR
ncbi:hypothetical protein [Gephyromycinifex aptenodytis]|uniref:hypothetical protein n=1 Tax=Gephyromycinifex aptenodytis TaxID=2716227 RepID=UPI001444E0FF|nr:hypothetical protein [Gephyromycinifex aptenodytis]